MKRYKVEIRTALYRMGVRDAILGRNPMKENPSYLRGFAEQYEREQINSSMPF